MSPGRQSWVLLGLAGIVVTGILVSMLFSLRAPHSLGFRVDLLDKGDELRTVTVYYLHPDTLKLVPVNHEVLAEHTSYELAEDLVAYLAQPSGVYRTPLPLGTKLLHYFDDGAGDVVLDFNLQIGYLRGDGIQDERLRLAALTRTLSANMVGVQRAKLMMLGRPLDRWGSHLALGGYVEVQP